MQSTRSWTRAILLVFIIGLSAACAPDQQPVPESSVPELPPPDAFTITVDPIGHWHVLGEKTLLFTVQQDGGEEGVAGLDLVVQIAQAESDRITERSVAGEQVTDEGDGVYSLAYTPSSIGAYSLAAGFVKDGQHFASAPVVFEVARDGDEGIKAEVNGTSYVYQIRYNWEPGHIHANDEEPVKLIFELMRGVQEGDEINWEQPWRNVFNHLTRIEDAALQIETEDGSLSETLDLAYKGRGIYEAERVFPSAEVGEGADYLVNLAFTDPFNGALISNPEAYSLHAAPGH